MTKHGWFRVIAYDDEFGDIEVGCDGLEDPDAEIIFCEWNEGDPNWDGRITFRGQTADISRLGVLILRSQGNFQKTLPKPNWEKIVIADQDAAKVADLFKRL